MKSKRISSFLIAVASMLLVGSTAQSAQARSLVAVDQPVQQDTLKKIGDADTVFVDTEDGRRKRVIITMGDNGRLDTVSFRRKRSVTILEDDNVSIVKSKKSSKVIWGITFSRIDLGLATLIDNGSFDMSPENRFLRTRTWRTTNLGFDLAQFGYRFDESFRLFLSTGLDWTYYRLREPVIFEPGAPELNPMMQDVHLSRNRLTSLYLRIPITLEHRFGEDRDFKVAYGPIGGFLLHGSQRYGGPQGRVKVREDFNFAKFRYGGFVRVGYKSFGLFAKYYLNDVFENSPAQDGVRNLSFGFMLGF